MKKNWADMVFCYGVPMLLGAVLWSWGWYSGQVRVESRLKPALALCQSDLGACRYALKEAGVDVVIKRPGGKADVIRLPEPQVRLVSPK